MSPLPAHMLSYEDGAYTIDASVLAPKLGLRPGQLMREMRRGLVFSVTERGEGEDTGGMRLTFRYRARSWVVLIDRNGSVHET